MAQWQNKLQQKQNLLGMIAYVSDNIIQKIASIYKVLAYSIESCIVNN